jgi:hypothetical protein
MCLVVKIGLGSQKPKKNLIWGVGTRASWHYLNTDHQSQAEVRILVGTAEPMSSRPFLRMATGVLPLYQLQCHLKASLRHK